MGKDHGKDTYVVGVSKIFFPEALLILALLPVERVFKKYHASKSAVEHQARQLQMWQYSYKFTEKEFNTEQLTFETQIGQLMSK